MRHSTRRQFTGLLGAGLTAGLGGCVEENGSHQADDPELDFIETGIITGERDTNWIRSVIQNRGDGPHGRLEVNHSVQDGAGGPVDTQTAMIDIIPPETTWVDYRMVLGQQRNQAEQVESRIITDDGRLSSSTVEDVEIIDSTLNQGFREGTEIIGEIENQGGDYFQLYLVGLVYTEDGILRGSVGHILNDVPANSRQTFRAAIASNNTPQTHEEELPTLHEVYIFDGIP